jgi:catechol 2,3-dioxygenase-like lactoylglutathione lyase family enzyme
MKSKISIITLGVSDLGRSTKFYKDGLGLKLRKESSENISFFDMGGTWLALYERDSLAKDANVPTKGGGFSGVTLAHNVKSKKEVDTILNEAKAAGAKVTDSAHSRTWGGYSGYFSDPDGHLWEVTWAPNLPL